MDYNCKDKEFHIGHTIKLETKGMYQMHIIDQLLMANKSVDKTLRVGVGYPADVMLHTSLIWHPMH